MKNLKVTVTELFALLVNFTRSCTANVTYLVPDRRSKTVKGEFMVWRKVNYPTAKLNHNYTNKVKTLSGSTDFVAEAPRGKERISSTIMRSLKSGLYLLDMKRLANVKAIVIALYHNGVELTAKDAEALDLWKPSYYAPSKPSTKGRGLVSEADDFTMLTVTLDNIISIKFDGTNYDVVKVPEELKSLEAEFNKTIEADKEA